MKRVRNMRELELLKENLEYRMTVSEKKLLGSAATTINNFTDGLKDWALKFGTSLVINFIRGSKYNNTKKSDN